MSRPKGSKNKKGIVPKGIAPFEFTHEANILRRTADGGFITDEFVPIGSLVPLAQIAPKVKASLKIGARWFHAEGTDVISAIQNLKPSITKGIGVLTIEQNGTKRERIINGRLLFQLFKGSSTMKTIAVKNFKTLFT